MSDASIDAPGMNAANGPTVASGPLHSCAIRGGQLWCWGNSSFGKLGVGFTNGDNKIPTRVGLAADWTSITAGTAHTCGVRGGELYCWGDYSADGNAALIPARVGMATGWTRVAAGIAHTCGIRAGELYCWGFNHVGQLGNGSVTPQPTPVRIGTADDWATVAAGDRRSCATKTAGELWCWGDGVTTPARIGADIGWTHIAVAEHTCAIRAGGLYCWGLNYNGVIGDGTTENRADPTRIGTDNDWNAITTTQRFTCGARAGIAYCWGRPPYGQLGSAVSTLETSPVAITSAGSWSELAACGRHTCGVRNGAIECWGSNAYGQLGDLTGQVQPSPVNTGIANLSAIDSFALQSCGVGTNNTLACWGTLQIPGQSGLVLGNKVPTLVDQQTVWTGVTVGTFHRCALQSGKLYCWGAGGDGQLGDGTTSNREAPAQIGTDTDWAVVTAGALHTCGIRTGLGAYCWGDNNVSQVGNNSSSDQHTPVNVGADFVQISAGTYHTCGLRSGGALACWGHSLYGAVGDGTTTPRGTPTTVMSGTNFSAVTAGSATSCAIRTSDQTLWCWGALVGDGTTMPRTTPVQIGTATDWIAISSGGGHTCGLRTGNTLWCWGANDHGEVGNNTVTAATAPITSPVQIGAATDWTAISAGEDHTCALKTGGALWCWGFNGDGQLGNDDAWQVAPVAVSGLP